MSWKRHGGAALVLAALLSGMQSPAFAAKSEGASAYYEDALIRFERNDLDGAEIQVKNALQQGYALDDQEAELGVGCIGVPIRDFDQFKQYALAIIGYTRDRAGGLAASRLAPGGLSPPSASVVGSRPPSAGGARAGCRFPTSIPNLRGAAAAPAADAARRARPPITVAERSRPRGSPRFRAGLVRA